MNNSKSYLPFLIVLFCFLGSSFSNAQPSDKKKSPMKGSTVKFVTSSAVSDDGLFTVHRDDEKILL